jgi:tRNA 2-thiouridine synthesizing protein E
MKNFIHKSRKYKVDDHGYLIDPNEWDENFAEGMAPKVRITGGLTMDHWKVIHFIRNAFEKMNVCPLVYVACRQNSLGLGDLNRLFPTGYHRGACKLAGISYRQGYFQKYRMEGNLPQIEADYKLKIYRIDAQGFLVDPSEWDENFALNKAFEMKMPELLHDKHWKIISYLREKYAKARAVPTFFQACEDNGISIDDFIKLFPDGYHRGAVKLAGLRIA